MLVRLNDTTRKMNKKFQCDNCGKKLPLWKIIKISFGPGNEKKIICDCSHVIKYRENLFLKYLPVFIAPIYIFIDKNWLCLLLLFFSLLISLVLYFLKLKKINKIKNSY